MDDDGGLGLRVDGAVTRNGAHIRVEGAHVVLVAGEGGRRSGGEADGCVGLDFVVGGGFDVFDLVREVLLVVIFT